MVVTAQPGAVPTASLYAQLSVMTQTATQAAAAQVTVASLVGSGPSAAVLTGVSGTALEIADAVVIVLPPPPSSLAQAVRPPPPPLSYIVAVNVTVPFINGAALTQPNVSAALAAVASVPVQAVAGATPPSYTVAEIRVAATLTVRGFGAALSQQQIAAVQQTLPLVLGVTSAQVAVAAGSAATGSAASSPPPSASAGGSASAIAAAVTVTVTGLRDI